MRRFVVDASVAVKWFRPEERHTDQARAILRDHTTRSIQLRAPSLLFLELINSAARRWRWPVEGLTGMVEELSATSLTFGEVDPATVVKWAAQGLSAYDSAYVALAEAHGILLLTDDEQILRTAPSIATALGGYSSLKR